MAVFRFDPFEKIIGDRFGIAELSSDVSEIDAGDETYLPRIAVRHFPQPAQESSNGFGLLRQSLAHHHRMKDETKIGTILKRLLRLARQCGALLRDVF